MRKKKEPWELYSFSLYGVSNGANQGKYTFYGDYKTITKAWGNNPGEQVGILGLIELF